MNRREALKTVVVSAGMLSATAALSAQPDEPKYLIRWGKIEEKNGVRHPLGWFVQAQDFEANPFSMTFTFQVTEMIYWKDHFVNGIKLAIEQCYRFHFTVERAGRNLPCHGGYRCASICFVSDDKIRLMFVRSEPSWGYFSQP